MPKLRVCRIEGELHVSMSAVRAGRRTHGLSMGVLLCAAALLCAGALGCSGEPQAVEQPAQGPDVPTLGVLELPVSLRTGDTAPADAYVVDLTPSGIRVGDQALMALEGGKLPAAERSQGTIAKLKQALSSPSKSSIALGVHASVPYDTLAAVLDTAKAAGIRAVAFKVRKPSGTEAGWLLAPNFGMTPKVGSETDVAVGSVDPRKWDEFAGAWQAVYDACRGAQTGSCAYVQTNVAKGGNLKIVLHAAGQGAAINFFRAGIEEGAVTDEEKARLADLAKKKEDFIQGRISKTDLEKELLEGPPATEALFQFRSHEAQTDPSPVTATLAPLCGTRACGAVVVADPNTLSVRVISLLGAAFPDGAAPPHLVFEQPWTEKAKLTTEQIVKQQAQDELDGKFERAAEAAQQAEQAE